MMITIKPRENIKVGPSLCLGLIASWLFVVAQMYHWEAQGMPEIASAITAMINAIPMVLLWIAMEGDGNQ